MASTGQFSSLAAGGGLSRGSNYPGRSDPRMPMESCVVAILVADYRIRIYDVMTLHYYLSDGGGLCRFMFRGIAFGWRDVGDFDSRVFSNFMFISDKVQTGQGRI